MEGCTARKPDLSKRLMMFCRTLWLSTSVTSNIHKYLLILGISDAAKNEAQNLCLQLVLGVICALLRTSDMKYISMMLLFQIKYFILFYFLNKFISSSLLKTLFVLNALFLPRKLNSLIAATATFVRVTPPPNNCISGSYCFRIEIKSIIRP